MKLCDWSKDAEGGECKPVIFPKSGGFELCLPFSASSAVTVVILFWPAPCKSEESGAADGWVGTSVLPFQECCFTWTFQVTSWPYGWANLVKGCTDKKDAQITRFESTSWLPAFPLPVTSSYTLPSKPNLLCLLVVLVKFDFSQMPSYLYFIYFTKSPNSCKASPTFMHALSISIVWTNLAELWTSLVIWGKIWLKGVVLCLIGLSPWNLI